jgi:hypothetical protein
MIDLPGDHPLPHAELASQDPLIFVVSAGEILYRHHQQIKDPVYFGKKGAYRFDDPQCPTPGCFGVLYAVARGRQQLLDQNVVSGRSRRTGGGRTPAEKKRQA